MSNDKFLAFDFGASSGRAYLGTFDGEKITAEEIHRFSNDPVITGGTMYWDILRLLFEIKQALIKAKQYGKISSIGIDTWGVDFGLLRKNGKLYENPVHYRDGRTAGMLEKAFEKIKKSRFYEITGNQFMEINTAFQLLSVLENEPEMLKSADCFLMMPDLLGYMLTGEKVCEMSIASTSQLFDQKAKKWSDEVISALGLEKRLFPRIVPSGTVVGTLTPELCRELDIEPANVVAVCGHDTQDAMLSVPATEEDFIFISCGTWSLFGTELDKPLMSDKAFELNVTNETGFAGKVSFLKNIIGLWLIQESRRAWQRQGKEYSFADMENMAREAKPFLCFIDPDDPLFVPAGDLPQRVKEYCKNTNQPVPETDGQVLRCIYESLALKYRHTLFEISECTGKEYKKVYIVGGGVKDALLCSMTAGACGVPVTAAASQATVFGNLACQLIAGGLISDYKKARQVISRSVEFYDFAPENADEWNKAYETYRRVTKC